MKRVGVAGLIGSGGIHSMHLLMGRRGKEPNKGLYVLPGGGVKDGESLEEALHREIFEETGLAIKDDPCRWKYSVKVMETEDRVILVADACVECRWRPEGEYTSAGFYDDNPIDGSDLYDVKWFGYHNLPWDISPVVTPILALYGWKPGKKPE
jgi:ADP-ribose pyrophosphatase YjhB (NUDIX family)